MNKRLNIKRKLHKWLALILAVVLLVPAVGFTALYSGSEVAYAEERQTLAAEQDAQVQSEDQEINDAVVDEDQKTNDAVADEDQEINNAVADEDQEKNSAVTDKRQEVFDENETAKAQPQDAEEQQTGASKENTTESDRAQASETDSETADEKKGSDSDTEETDKALGAYYPAQTFSDKTENLTVGGKIIQRKVSVDLPGKVAVNPSSFDINDILSNSLF